MTSSKSLLKNRIPKLFFILKGLKKWYYRKYDHSNITLPQLADLLINNMGLRRGDTIMVHTSLHHIRSQHFSPEDVIYLLMMIVGKEGTLIMPTFTAKHYTFLYKKKPFDCRKTMGKNGLINELFRMMLETKRSCHPLKSVAAWGKNADYLIKDHHLSECAFDKNSPFYRLYELEGKIVGLGVTSAKLSFFHTIEDTNPEYFPSQRYSEPVEKKYIDLEGNSSEGIFRHDIQEYVRLRSKSKIFKYYRKNELFDFKFDKIPFFVADCKKLYNRTVELVKQGISIYNI
jgi:aminoglycoside 3-N-acetyltransferase